MKVEVMVVLFLYDKIILIQNIYISSSSLTQLLNILYLSYNLYKNNSKFLLDFYNNLVCFIISI